ncbi:glycosyltransferase [candidate division KSB1 bacterium]|nr:glycosyltransferase [candidate division KSB1 bacterium]MBL7086663.1 glycosyltransferase [Candidatus Cloacimonadota bacterium]
MNQSSKICHLTIGHSALDDRIFFKEIKSLKKIFDDVTVVASGKNKRWEKDGVKIIEFEKSHLLKNLIKCYKIAKFQKAKIYHIHEPELLLIVLLLKWLYGSKIIYDVHEFTFLLFIEFSPRRSWKSWILAIFFQGLEWLCSIFVNTVIVSTPFLTQRFKKLNKNTFEILNFVDTNLFFPGNYQKNRSSPYILYHGQIAEARHSMIETIKYLRKNSSNIKLKLIGSVTSKIWGKQISDLIKKLDIENCIEILPPILHDQITKFVQNATIGFASMNPNRSFMKSVQIKPFEFMACGIPVIAARTHTLQKFIEDEKAGILLEDPTPQKVADAVRFLLENPEKAKEMGKNGRNAVLKKYYWAKMEKKLIYIYKKLLKN